MQCLKNCLQFNVLEGSVSSINPIPTDAFWPRNHWQWNDPHNVFIWIENCYLLTWNLAHILCNLNALKEAIKFFWIWHEFFTEVIIYQHLQQVTYLLLAFVRLEILVLFFLCFMNFCESQCHFYNNTFILTFIMGIFYFILV